MKKFNLSKGTLYFPLKADEEVVNGAAYEIVDGKAQKVAGTGATSNVVGICVGGDNVRDGQIMLDIDPTAVYTESYTGAAPALGSFVHACKLVIGVDTAAKTFDYLVRKVSYSPTIPTDVWTVTFNVDGGSSVTAQLVIDGGKATEPEDPTKSEKTFDGWYTSAAKTTEFDFDDPITENTTIYAKWANAT